MMEEVNMFLWVYFDINQKPQLISAQASVEADIPCSGACLPSLDPGQIVCLVTAVA